MTMYLCIFDCIFREKASTTATNAGAVCLSLRRQRPSPRCEPPKPQGRFPASPLNPGRIQRSQEGPHMTTALLSPSSRGKVVSQKCYLRIWGTQVGESLLVYTGKRKGEIWSMGSQRFYSKICKISNTNYDSNK